jgi:hypothetical protein
MYVNRRRESVAHSLVFDADGFDDFEVWCLMWGAGFRKEGAVGAGQRGKAPAGVRVSR